VAYSAQHCHSIASNNANVYPKWKTCWVEKKKKNYAMRCNHLLMRRLRKGLYMLEELHWVEEWICLYASVQYKNIWRPRALCNKHCSCASYPRRCRSSAFLCNKRSIISCMLLCSCPSMVPPGSSSFFEGKAAGAPKLTVPASREEDQRGVCVQHQAMTA
jgi:hypothetical protein